MSYEDVKEKMLMALDEIGIIVDSTQEDHGTVTAARNTSN